MAGIAEWTPWGAISAAAGLLIYFLANPAKVEKWSAMIAAAAEGFTARAARHSAASEIQSSVSAYVKETGSKDVLPYGLKIAWAGEDAVESYVDKRSNKVVVIMRYRRNRSRSFVAAVREYTSKSFMPSIRHDIPPKIAAAAELVMQEKIIRAEREDALEMFRAEALPFQIGGDEELGALHTSLKRIEELGFFENIFLNELIVASEGLRTFDAPRKADEMVSLIAFLAAFHKRRPGEDIALEHDRSLFKLGVILVARAPTIAARGTRPYVERARASLSRGLRSIYVTGAKDDRRHVARVADDISAGGVATKEWMRDYRKTRDMKVQNYTIAFFRR